MKCEVCGIEITGKAKTCSPRCRKILSRKRSVTENPSVTTVTPDIEASVTFEFRTLSKANGMGREKDEWSRVRKAKYWYDVPIAAVPVVKKNWPEVPGYMNGRQYFLWWKNEFKTNGDSPEILLPQVRNFRLDTEA